MKTLLMVMLLLLCGAAQAGTGTCPDPQGAGKPAANGETKIDVVKKTDGCPALRDVDQSDQKHKKQHKVTWQCKDGCKNGDKLEIRFQDAVSPAPQCQGQRCQWKPDAAVTYSNPLSYVMCVNSKCTDPRIIIEDY